MQSKKIRNRKWLVLPVIALLFFVLTQISANSPEFIEFYYSQNIYPIIAFSFSLLSNWIPFSLDDIFYLLLIYSAIFIVVLLILKKISLKKSGKIVLNLMSAVYILFYFLWGFNYFRNDLNTRLLLNEQEPDKEEFLAVLKNLVEKTNASYCSFEDFEKVKIDSLIEKSFKNLAPALKIKYPSGKRNAKKITFSGFFAKAGISGYFGPFFNEIHINKNNLPVEYPLVLAHEKAHQFGITSEAEANFYAWLVCSQSQSKQLQYSANLHILQFFMNQGYQLKKYPEIIIELDEKVKTDYQKIRRHWLSLRNEKVDRVATKVNDTYLKTNKVEKGIEDYRGVVKYVMDFSMDSTFQKKYNLYPY